MALKCPRCGTNTYVIDSRPEEASDGLSITRRRVCKNCKATFRTYEEIWDRDLKKYISQRLKK